MRYNLTAGPWSIIAGDQIIDAKGRLWTCVYTTLYAGGNHKEMQFVREGRRLFGIARVKRLYDEQVIKFQTDPEFA